MKKIIGWVVLIFQTIFCIAQSNVNEADVSAVKDIYQKHIPLHQLLRSGRSYEHFYLATEGNQYLIDPLAHSGELYYQGVFFPSVPLNYDIYNQLVIISFTLDGYQKSLILNEKRIAYMNLQGMRFVFLAEDSVYNRPEGIYQEVFKGEHYGFWVKRRKKLNNQTASSSGANRYKFVQADQHYLWTGTETARISNKKDLLKALGNTQEVATLIKENNLNFKKKQPTFVQNTGILLNLLENRR